jgi:hypothetical protein
MARWWDGRQWTNDVRSAGGPGAGGGGLDPGADAADEARAGRVARLALWAGAVVYSGRLLVSAVLFGRIWRAFRRWLDLPADTRPRFVLPGGFAGLNAMEQLLGLGATAVGVLFLIWFYKAATVATRLGLPSRRSTGWAVAGWIVPIVQLWFPYQSAVDLLPPGHAARRKVTRWWALWLVISLFSLLEFAAVIISTEVGVVVAGLGSVVAFAAAWAAQDVIAEVDRVHADLVAAVRHPSPPGGYQPWSASVQ